MCVIHLLQMISLLKRSLTSNNALTAHYFDTAIASDDSAIDILTENMYPEQGNDADPNLNDVKIKVLQTKNNSSVLYAEVGANFVDLLFGLLCIPLGSIMKTYGKCASKGCVDNLYGNIYRWNFGILVVLINISQKMQEPQTILDAIQNHQMENVTVEKGSGAAESCLGNSQSSHLCVSASRIRSRVTSATATRPTLAVHQMNKRKKNYTLAEVILASC
uniref:Uncharacterized protein n=1 Tax=Aegilops tauschii TaxID=37682 RepID=M8BRE5_AEGTA